ncbi:MAG: (2Fe-2S)-binding protein [Kiritimatiellae bacterium]|nr:(2Fe-2S)-binding protein [Kiritimatiellia bacterium]
MNIQFTLNGKLRTAEVEANTKLADLLRELGCASVKIGCNEGACGSCAVNVDGRLINSCLTYAGQVNGRTVETVEAIGSLDHPHPIQDALVEEGAIQCGYCMPGVILAAKALFDKNPSPTEEELAVALDGQLCRCTGYQKIESALRKLASEARS